MSIHLVLVVLGFLSEVDVTQRTRPLSSLLTFHPEMQRFCVPLHVPLAGKRFLAQLAGEGAQVVVNVVLVSRHRKLGAERLFTDITGVFSFGVLMLKPDMPGNIYDGLQADVADAGDPIVDGARVLFQALLRGIALITLAALVL